KRSCVDSIREPASTARKRRSSSPTCGAMSKQGACTDNKPAAGPSSFGSPCPRGDARWLRGAGASAYPTRTWRKCCVAERVGRVPGGDVARSFDHQVGSGEYRGRNCKPECFCGLEVHSKREQGWSLEREVARICPMQNLVEQRGLTVANFKLLRRHPYLESRSAKISCWKPCFSSFARQASEKIRQVH